MFRRRRLQPAVLEDSNAGIELPRQISAEVVTVEDWTRKPGAADERDRLFGKELARRDGGRARGESAEGGGQGPSYQIDFSS